MAGFDVESESTEQSRFRARPGDGFNITRTFGKHSRHILSPVLTWLNDLRQGCLPPNLAGESGGIPIHLYALEARINNERSLQERIEGVRSRRCIVEYGGSASCVKTSRWPDASFPMIYVQEMTCR